MYEMSSTASKGLMMSSPHLVKMSPLGENGSPLPSCPNTPSSNQPQGAHRLMMNIKVEPGSGGNNSENNAYLATQAESKCKRKINFSHLGVPQRGNHTVTVARRNARERNRVKQVNNGFAALKHSIPLGHRSKKMSKVETLRCAVEYIKNLKVLLDATGGGSLSPASLQSHSHHHSANSNSSSGETPDFILQDDEDDEDEDKILSKSPSQSDFSSVSEFEQAYMNSGQSHHHLHPAQFFAGASMHFGNGTPQPNHQLSPTSSEDPQSPPFVAEGSYVTSAGQGQPAPLPNLVPNGSHNGNASSTNNTAMYDYENYEPVSPEDEELLDAISWWQQS